MKLEEALKQYNEAHSTRCVALVYGDGSGGITEHPTSPYDNPWLLECSTDFEAKAIKWLVDNSIPQWEKDAEDLIRHIVANYGTITTSEKRTIKQWFKERAEK